MKHLWDITRLRSEIDKFFDAVSKKRFPELKHCPFCGGFPQTVVDDETEEKYGVKCFCCGGSISPEKETVEEAIEAWNRRAAINETPGGHNENQGRQNPTRGHNNGRQPMPGLERCGQTIRACGQTVRIIFRTN